MPKKNQQIVPKYTVPTIFTGKIAPKSPIVGSAEQARDFIGNTLESSTACSIIGEDLKGKILLWNEGARRLYGYQPQEVV